MAFVATGGSKERGKVVVRNANFFPDVDVEKMREEVTAAETVTEARLVSAIKVAVIVTNRQLFDAGWVEEKQGEGYGSLSEVAAGKYMPDGGYVDLYMQAVYCEAMATVVDRYRGVTNSAASEDGERRESMADEYRRDAALLVSEIVGSDRVLVSLI